jgi:hypothetical protein
MSHQFPKHYTHDEAQALLPQIREWLTQLRAAQSAMEKGERKLRPIIADGQDTGGATVNGYFQTVADLRDVLAEFARRAIMLQDLHRGLIDFPALMGGREVFLCWEDGEEAVEFWHDLDAGYAGRERIRTG